MRATITNTRIISPSHGSSLLKSKVLEYGIRVEYDGRSWTVYRRYSEIRLFRETLINSSATSSLGNNCRVCQHQMRELGQLVFPGRNIFSKTAGLETRRIRALNEFFMNLFSYPSLDRCLRNGCAVASIIKGFLVVLAQEKPTDYARLRHTTFEDMTVFV